MDETTLWTLDELTQQVAQALAAGYDGQRSGRVRDMPDQRTIRWYVTRGLVDPPLATRGRQARYGRRHLLQLLAIKRRQSVGLPLAAIQAEFAGLLDAELATIADLPPVPQDPVVHDHASTFSAPDAPPAPDTPSVSRASAAPAGRTRFWSQRPDSTATASEGTPLNDTPRATAEGELRAVRLAPGVVLLLDTDLPLAQLSMDALRTASAPLLDLLDPSSTDEGNPP